MTETKRDMTVPAEMRDPVLPGGAFSHSQYDTYKACGKSYEFRYVKNVASPPSPAMVRGTALHRAIEHALIVKKDGGRTDLDEQLSLASDAFDQAKEQIEEWGEDAPGKHKDTVLRLYRVYHASALPLMNPIEIEQPFVVKVGSVTVRGVIDLVDHERDHPGDPGRLVVADLKTSSSKWSQNDVDKDAQLTLYTAVKRQVYGRIDNLVSTKTAAYHRLDTTRKPTDHRNLIEDYEDTVDLIKRGAFPMAPMDSWKCGPRWCQYWGVCRGR